MAFRTIGRKWGWIRWERPPKYFIFKDLAGFHSRNLYIVWKGWKQRKPWMTLVCHLVVGQGQLRRMLWINPVLCGREGTASTHLLALMSCSLTIVLSVFWHYWRCSITVKITVLSFSMLPEMRHNPTARMVNELYVKKCECKWFISCI